MTQCSFTRIYNLPSFFNAEKYVVCKAFFKQTSRVSDVKIDLTLKKEHHSSGPVPDKLGWHQPHNRTHADEIKFVCNFINDLPTNNSHYSRKDNISKQYLLPLLNFSELYRLYKE
jgi:hypothetical protein